MNSKILLTTSFRSLKHHKGRSFLTILGIIVGISAIIATLAIGHGAQEKLRTQIMTLGNNYIELWAGRSFTQGTIASSKLKQPKNITITDIKTIHLQCPSIQSIAPFLFERKILEYQGIPLLTMIKGTNHHALKALGRKIKKGTFLAPYHSKKSSRVIVLGTQAAKELFKAQDPLGKTIKINGIFFIVIGILDRIENYMGIYDPNLEAFIPYTTMQKFLSNHPANIIHSIVISAKNLDELSELVRKVRIIFRSKHNLSIDEPDDFTIIDQQSMIKAAHASSQTLNLFLLIVASIALLVGGIGVMNIMLVSVAERTKEIGIRMALGAPTQLILKQFLYESITLCFIGGVIGIILGIIAPYLAHLIAGFPVIIKIHFIMLALLTIFCIGIIFGYYPARKAAQLNPIEALQES